MSLFPFAFVATKPEDAKHETETDNSRQQRWNMPKSKLDNTFVDAVPIGDRDKTIFDHRGTNNLRRVSALSNCTDHHSYRKDLLNTEFRDFVSFFLNTVSRLRNPSRIQHKYRPISILRISSLF